MSCQTKEEGRCQASLETSRSKNAGLGTGEIPAEKPAEEITSGIMNRNMSLLVAAGSAMAAGCEPCMDQLIPSLIEAEVSDRDIRRAVEVGQSVKEAAAEYMKEVADVLAGTRLAGSRAPEQVLEGSITESGGCCG